MSVCPVMMLNTNSSPSSSPIRRSRGHSFTTSSTSNQSPPQSPPAFSRPRVNSISSMVDTAVPASPTIKMNMRIQKIPSIATTSASSTPPQSPVTKKEFTFQPNTAAVVQSPTRKNRMVLNLAAKATPALTTTTQVPTSNTGVSVPAINTITPKPSGLSVSSNDRVQPVAAAKPSSGGGKRKLGPGCGLLDWIRFCRKTKDLAGNGGVKRQITLDELEQHCTEDDAWTAIRGKVYNLTPYFKFHPGGKEELMKAVGKDCTILFDEVHKWVNVESTLKACVVGPLVASSPNTQRRNSVKIVKNARRKDSSTNLTVAKPQMITDGVNKQAVPASMRKNSVERRTETQAATACEEPDGLRQISPESPIRPLVGENAPKKSSITTQEAAEGSSIRLVLPPIRHRRTSEPHPRFDWVQSEKAVTIHIVTQDNHLKTSDVVLDVKGQSFEAAIFISGDWVFELNIALAHAITASQVSVNFNRVEISLKKLIPHHPWETIGTFREGHASLSPKSRRGVKYHETRVENIRTVTHDTKLFTLRLPAASYINVPTGHHLSIKTDINGEEVERSYTPVGCLDAVSQRHAHTQCPEGEVIELMIKLYKDGKMSGFLSQLEKGDKVMVSDPDGTFDAHSRLNSASNMLLIAAGSGFTPMVNLLRDYTSSEVVSRQRNANSCEAPGEAGKEEQPAPELPPLTNEATKEQNKGTQSPAKTAKLLFANKKERDVMYREELEHLTHITRQSFTVTHVLSDAEKSWAGLRGRLDRSLVRECLPPVNPKRCQDSLVCICGPEPFTNMITNMLVEFDFPDECIHIFQ